MASAGSLIDVTKPLSGHSLNKGLVGDWWPVPNSGHRGGLSFRDLIRGTHDPNDGTLSSGAKWSGSKGLPGSTGCIGCTGGASFTLPLPAITQPSAFTISWWIFPTSWTGGFTAMIDDASRNYSIFFDTSGNVSFTGGSSIFNGLSSTASGVPTGKWSNILVTRDSITPFTLFMYLNGIQVGSNVNNSNTASAATISFGTNPSGGGTNFDGFYGGFQLYKGRTHSPAEVVALMEEFKQGRPNTINWLDNPWQQYPAVFGAPAAVVSRQQMLTVLGMGA